MTKRSAQDAVGRPSWDRDWDAIWGKKAEGVSAESAQTGRDSPSCRRLLGRERARAERAEAALAVAKLRLATLHGPGGVGDEATTARENRRLRRDVKFLRRQVDEKEAENNTLLRAVCRTMTYKSVCDRLAFRSYDYHNQDKRRNFFRMESELATTQDVFDLYVTRLDDMGDCEQRELASANGMPAWVMDAIEHRGDDGVFVPTNQRGSSTSLFGDVFSSK